MKIPSFCLSCILGALSFAALADAQVYNVRSLSVDEGLSQSMAYCILQDSRGFIWIGTQDGLNRYDGQHFSVFKHNPKDYDTVGSDRFFSIYEDAGSRIWLGTDKGIDIYNPSLEKFTRFSVMTADGADISSCIRHISEDGEGNIWIAGDGASLFCFSKDSSLRKYDIASFIETEPDAVSIRDLIVDEDVLWMSTACGLLRMNLDDGSVSRCRPAGDCGKETTCIVPYMSGRLLVGTASCGVQIYDKASGVFSDFMHCDPETGNPLYVRKIMRASDGLVWIGTESGVYVYNPRDKSTSRFRHIGGNPYSLSDNAVHSIAEDSDGGVWVGTYFGGVNYFSKSCPFEKYFPVPGENTVSGRCISEFCEDGNGNLWIATEDAGLDCLNLASGTFVHKDIPATNVHALMVNGNELWAGTFSSGLYVMNIRTGAYKVYRNEGKEGSLLSNDIYSIFRDSDSVVWVGTSAGLNKYDPKTDSFARVRPELISRQVNDICEDWLGNIWLAVVGGGFIAMTAITASGGIILRPPILRLWTQYA